MKQVYKDGYTASYALIIDTSNSVWTQAISNFAVHLESSPFHFSVSLLSGNISHEAIQASLAKLKTIDENAQVLIFVRGEVVENDSIYLTCGDTNLDDLKKTAISLESILSISNSSKVKHIAIVLDIPIDWKKYASKTKLGAPAENPTKNSAYQLMTRLSGHERSLAVSLLKHLKKIDPSEWSSFFDIGYQMAVELYPTTPIYLHNSEYGDFLFVSR